MRKDRDHTYGRLTLTDTIENPREQLETLSQTACSDHLNRYEIDILEDEQLYWAVGDQTYDIIQFTEYTFPGRGDDEIEFIVPAGTDETDTIGFRYTDHTEDMKADALFSAATQAIEAFGIEEIEYNLMLDI